MTSSLQEYDLLVIGGGVNGTGIAADASGRGLKVLMCEMNDLGSATSSNSSKLIHGGLRYLEHYEFRLVKEALAEREVLLNKAPHIMWPMRFQLPHQPHLRPAWMIRIGLFMYDHLSKRVTLPASKSIKFTPEEPLVRSIKKGFEYSDGWVDDARLVVLNALSAKEQGADILTRTKVVSAKRANGVWNITLLNMSSGEKTKVIAKAIVNAAGPWVVDIFDSALEQTSPEQIRLVRGSHIIVPKIHDGEQAFILQNSDNRIVFVIPYENDFSLIGTTDIEHQGKANEVHISDEEIDYLIEITNEYFVKKIERNDIVHTFSGVRPLLDDGSDSAQFVTRDYTLELDAPSNEAPLLSIFGGKITTFRKLAEAATDKICEFFPEAGPAWTKTPPLPGGDFENQNALLEQYRARYSWAPEHLLRRYIRQYGTRAKSVLENAGSMEDLGQHFGASLYAAEIDYLVDQEWTLSAEDILWRRTKLGLFIAKEEIARIELYLESYLKKASPENTGVA